MLHWEQKLLLVQILQLDGQASQLPSVLVRLRTYPVVGHEMHPVKEHELQWAIALQSKHLPDPLVIEVSFDHKGEAHEL